MKRIAWGLAITLAVIAGMGALHPGEGLSRAARAFGPFALAVWTAVLLDFVLHEWLGDDHPAVAAPGVEASSA